MKGRLVAFVGIFCIAILVVSVANAVKPEKTPKPPKLDEPKAECIVFTEQPQSFEGITVIEGCCPNAGPWPAYTMTLDVPGIPPGTYDGQLFINVFGTGPDAQYKVQFWTWDYDNEDPVCGDYFFEIYGGVLDRDRKAKTLTVTFDGSELATGWVCDDAGDSIEISIPGVSFVLFRTSDLSHCE